MAYDFRPLQTKSVDDLEGHRPEPPFASPLMERIALARRVPLAQLTVENLRLLVTQRQAPTYIVPAALERLEEHPFAAGDMYRGDLLMAFLQADAFWPAEAVFRNRVHALITQALRTLEALRPVDWAGGEIPDPEALTELDRESLAPTLEAALARTGE